MGILSIFLFSIVFGSLHDFASTISTLKTTNHDQTTCEMCYSCDNPCQPIVSPPPSSPPPPPVLSAPPPLPPPVMGTSCPPPMPSPPALPELNNRPPPPSPHSNDDGVGVYYFSPPPPTESTYFPPLYGGGGTYSPPRNIPYSWPNPTFPYLPFSYFCPPPPGISISHSAKLNSHPFFSASLVMIFFCLLFIP